MRLAAHVDRERRRRGVKKLLGVVVGSSARRRRPISAATSRTRATTALSSVSGRVKNWGAWGSMAPPITDEIMVASA
jgi:hypothetical protein